MDAVLHLDWLLRQAHMRQHVTILWNANNTLGEDYVVPGLNAVVLQTTDPQEFLGLFGELRANPTWERSVRRAGRVTAKRYAWSHIMKQTLLPRVRLLAGMTTHRAQRSALTAQIA